MMRSNTSDCKFVFSALLLWFMPKKNMLNSSIRGDSPIYEWQMLQDNENYIAFTCQRGLLQHYHLSYDSRPRGPTGSLSLKRRGLLPRVKAIPPVWWDRKGREVIHLNIDITVNASPCWRIRVRRRGKAAPMRGTKLPQGAWTWRDG